MRDQSVRFAMISLISRSSSPLVGGKEILDDAAMRKLRASNLHRITTTLDGKKRTQVEKIFNCTNNRSKVRLGFSRFPADNRNSNSVALTRIERNRPNRTYSMLCWARNKLKINQDKSRKLGDRSTKIFIRMNERNEVEKQGYTLAWTLFEGISKRGKRGEGH